MGQTSPAKKALNQRMVELVRVAVRAAPSVAAVARASGVPRTTLQNIISDSEERPVTVDQAVRLAVALGVDPAVWMEELRATAIALGVRRLTKEASSSTRSEGGDLPGGKATRGRSA